MDIEVISQRNQQDVLQVVAAVLVDRAGRVLIAQRPPGKWQAGRWEFPGGKVEPGESEEAAVRRVGVPEDVANTVAFLVSDEASFISGQTIYVSGGPTV